jgi:hypothetical protein
MTEFEDTTTSSNTFCGGSGAGDGSNAVRSPMVASLPAVAGGSTLAAGETVEAAGLAGAALVGHGRSSAGSSCRAVVPAGLAGDAGLRAGSVPLGAAAGAADLAAAGSADPAVTSRAGSAISASVSWTGGSSCEVSDGAAMTAGA